MKIKKKDWEKLRAAVRELEGRNSGLVLRITLLEMDRTHDIRISQLERRIDSVVGSPAASGDPDFHG